MNKEIAMEWAARLPAFKQGAGWLRTTSPETGDKFCCLGVLCEIAVEKGIIPKGEPYTGQSVMEPNDQDGTLLERYYYGQPGDDEVLPKVVRDWAEMGTADGTFGTTGDGSPDSLVSMNDGGSSFEEIAKAIKERWVEL